jgi:hypothetical protein
VAVLVRLEKSLALDRGQFSPGPESFVMNRRDGKGQRRILSLSCLSLGLQVAMVLDFFVCQ